MNEWINRKLTRLLQMIWGEKSILIEKTFKAVIGIGVCKDRNPFQFVSS